MSKLTYRKARIAYKCDGEGCGRTIQVGAMYLRRVVRGGGKQTSVRICYGCSPLHRERSGQW
jgi:hypothetical protein